MSATREAADLFDRHAATYRASVDAAVGYSGRDLSFFTEAKAHQLRAIGAGMARPFGQLEVLDVGCGAGALDNLLAGHFGRLVGVDVSQAMLDAARRLNPGIDYRVYSGDQLPFDDQSFDLVFAVCVVHHVCPVEWDQFVEEMWRVTRHGGKTVIIEHNPLNPLTRRSVAACPFDEDAVLASPKQLARIFETLRARSVTRRYFLFTPFGGARVQAVERRLFSGLPFGAQYVVEALR